MRRKVNNLSFMNVTTILVVSVVTVLITWLLLTSFFGPVATQKMDARVVVGDRLGYDTTGEYLEFGILRPNMLATKDVMITAQENAIVKVVGRGSIKQFLSVSQNNFLVEEGETVNLDISAGIPSDVKEGEYSGKIWIFFMKP